MIQSPYLRGDVWLVDFGADPTGPEQAFHRPAVIVSDDQLHHPRLRMVVVIARTTTIRDLPLHLEVSSGHDDGLVEPTAFQVEQIRAVSTLRLVERLGRLDPASRHALDEILRTVLRLAATILGVRTFHWTPSNEH